MQCAMSQDGSSSETFSTVGLPEGVKMRLPNGDFLYADGTVQKEKKVIQPAVQTVREVQNGRTAARTLEKMHRKLGDLPEGDSKQLNAIAAILTYTQVGLSDADIASALGTHEEVVKNIKELDAYRQLSDMFDTNVFDDAKRTASHILARASANAADKLVAAVDSPNDQISVVASREVLKMNGISAETQTSERKSGLNIRILRKGEKRDETITLEI